MILGLWGYVIAPGVLMLLGFYLFRLAASGPTKLGLFLATVIAVLAEIAAYYYVLHVSTGAPLLPPEIILLPAALGGFSLGWALGIVGLLWQSRKVGARAERPEVYEIAIAMVVLITATTALVSWMLSQYRG